MNRRSFLAALTAVAALPLAALRAPVRSIVPHWKWLGRSPLWDTLATDKLATLQLARAGLMDHWTLFDRLGVPNMGPPPPRPQRPSSAGLEDTA